MVPQHMESRSVFLQLEFFLLLLFSFLIPALIYGWLMFTRSISRWTVLLLGVILLLLSAVDTVLLSHLAQMARSTPSLWDGRIFSSEVSLALYLLPLTAAGIGINLITHVMITHLNEAEQRFDELKKQAERGSGPEV
ncbi:MAG: hypothetical protein ACRCRW_13360 [Aeromonadaceae bacterium]